MRLVKFNTTNGRLWLNPEHVTGMFHAVGETIIYCTGGQQWYVKELPDVIEALLQQESRI